MIINTPPAHDAHGSQQGRTFSSLMPELMDEVEPLLLLPDPLPLLLPFFPTCSTKQKSGQLLLLSLSKEHEMTQEEQSAKNRSCQHRLPCCCSKQRAG